MKKLMMMSVLVTIIGLTACAQKINPSKVPVAVKATFAKQFPSSFAKWEKEDGKFEASFKKRRQYHECIV
jgi:hypothetical protein